VEPVRYRAWRQLRRRRWGALALVALIGLLGGVTLAALIGARRNATAYHRLLVHAQPWDVLVNPDLGSQSGLQPAKVATLPQVRAASGLAGYATLPQGASLNSPDFEDTETLAFTTPTALGGLFRPKIVTGRLPDPARADEVAIDPRYAARHDLHPGSTLSLTLLDAQSQSANPPSQALPALTVTGIILTPDEVSQAQGTDSARILLTPAFDALHHPWMEYFGVLAWLKDPARDLAAFRSGVQALVPKETVDLQTQTSTTSLAQQAIRPETVALVAFGLLAGAAALVIAAQMLVRRVSEDDDDLALAAAGMTRLQRWGARMAEVTALAAGGATVAIAVAIAASGVFPVGPAATAEPSPGFHVNVAWILVGWLAIVALLVLTVAFPAWRASRLGVGESAAAVRRSRVVETLARSGAAPTAVVGVRMALETGRGRRSVPLRLSLLGSVVGIGLLVGAVVFGASLRNLLDRPDSYGWRWDATTSIDIPDPSQMPTAEHYIQTVTGRPQVLQAAVLENSTVSLGSHSVAALGWRPLRGELAPTLLSGRLPTGPAEMAVGAKTLATTGHSVGDTMTVSGPAGSQPLEIVGEVIFPSIAKYSGADNADLGTGVLLNQKALDGIAPAPDQQHVVVTLAKGADANDVLVGGFEDPSQQGGLTLLAQPQRPGAVVDLDQVRAVPLWLAVLFGVGGVLAITNLVGTAIARRRRDLALLKSLGFVRRQLHRAVAWHATAISLITVAVAIPLGIIAGRVAWRYLAHSLGVAPTVTVPILLFVLIVPATILVANLAAAIPARMAARTSTALALRSE
jgi:hypothetical protein